MQHLAGETCGQGIDRFKLRNFTGAFDRNHKIGMVHRPVGAVTFQQAADRDFGVGGVKVGKIITLNVEIGDDDLVAVVTADNAIGQARALDGGLCSTIFEGQRHDAIPIRIFQFAGIAAVNNARRDMP